jgi:hypothetical protein
MPDGRLSSSVEADIMTGNHTSATSPRDYHAPYCVIGCAAVTILMLSALVLAQPNRQLFPLWSMRPDFACTT